MKEPGTRQRTPWHQDLPYYNVDGRLNISMWFPVDPVSRSSTLEFVAGSHLGPWFMPRTFLDGQAKWFPDGTLAELPPIDDEPERFRLLGWALEPGDAVFFHMLTPARGRRGRGPAPPSSAARSASWVTTWCTHRATGSPRRSSQGWPRSYPPAPRSIIPAFPSSGRREALPRR